MQFPKALLLAAGLTFCGLAAAQWQWMDKDGNKVFSDRAPPSDIPEKSIVKRPGGTGRPAVQAPTASAPASAAASAAGAAPKISGSDPALEAKKKQAEDAEAAQRKVEAERQAKIRADNCVRARQSKSTLDSGIRIARTNEKGEREIIDDATRDAEGKRLQDVMASDCR